MRTASLRIITATIIGATSMALLPSAAAGQTATELAGSISGTVTDRSTHEPIAGATVTTFLEERPTSTTTASDGTYTLSDLPKGTYEVTASSWTYRNKVATTDVEDDVVTTLDFALAARPTAIVEGKVKSSGPFAGATVTIVDTPIPPATTGADGGFSFANVPHGTYTFYVTYGGCATPFTASRKVNGPETFTFKPARKTDVFGHQCDLRVPAFITGDTEVTLSGDDVSTAVPLPFPFSMYGVNYATANVATNGHLSFTAPSTYFDNTPIPDPALPNAAIYPQWDDLFIDPAAGVFTRLQGSAPNRRFTIEWRDIRPFDYPETWDFEVVIYEAGKVLFQYRQLEDARSMGGSATVGIENSTGNDALQYSFNLAVLNNTTAILFTCPGAGPF